MRLLTLTIALVALGGVAYLSLKAPSGATLYGDDIKIASAQPVH